jgi:hypothetical protein
MQSFNIAILAADGPVSIPIEDLAEIIFVLIATNDWNGDEISIVEVASALREGLPNWIIPDAKVSATETKEGAPEDRSLQEDLVDWIEPAIGCAISPEALAEVILPLIRDFMAGEDEITIDDVQSTLLKGLADLADLMIDCVPDLEDLVDEDDAVDEDDEDEDTNKDEDGSSGGVGFHGFFGFTFVSFVSVVYGVGIM